ncbi:hypothetical protein B0T16DRAFT_499290 [Cercophora newfieldiana]|uniref:Uncharacterized protein n=1 Tax=Cercophora newfieldiana TaxID=92897 RepID=A0AA39YMU7_9PEZI|nr:hypothetical protein B0T16DRAFT_499290 [Cercophora newfieldiana]
MLEQQQLEESEKQLQAEIDKTGNHTTSQGPGQNHGSLSNANLGASSLTLKHLIARIDMKRDQVRVSDAELRLLINEVYNQEMSHPLRRMANGMRKEAEKLIPLIPNLVIRPHAEVKAEERRKQNGGDDNSGKDSDDEPIMSSHGRGKGAKTLNGLLTKSYREGSEVNGSNSFATPPIAGSITLSGINGHSGVSNVDVMDINRPSLNGMALGQALGEAAEQAYKDEEYKIWKQVTKKDRALITKERYQLFVRHTSYALLVPPSHFVTPASKLTKRFDTNLQQIQETRKVCSKISVIKQMQIQTQVYINQFPKYNPEPFLEQDIKRGGTHITGDYFQKIVRTFNLYREAEKKPATGSWAERGARFQPRFTPKEIILHTLAENSHDTDTLEAYARDDIDRLGSKLGTIHKRMRAHYADLLRPALTTDTGADGSGAFNDGIHMGGCA